jgi:hypothetical protein
LKTNRDAKDKLTFAKFNKVKNNVIREDIKKDEVIKIISEIFEKTILK